MLKMKKKEKTSNQKNRIETILKMAISASLGSLGIVLSTIVVFVPNFELISVTIFLISLLFGVYYGLLAAISISLVYEFIITLIVGPAPYLFPFKLICYIILALIAGLTRKFFLRLSFWELGILGSLFALIYDVFVTIGFVTIGSNKLIMSILLAAIVNGTLLTIIHVIGNFILFSLTKTILNWILAAFKVRGLKQLMLPNVTTVKEISLMNSDEVDK